MPRMETNWRKEFKPFRSNLETAQILLDSTMPLSAGEREFVEQLLGAKALAERDDRLQDAAINAAIAEVGSWKLRETRLEAAAEAAAEVTE